MQVLGIYGEVSLKIFENPFYSFVFSLYLLRYLDDKHGINTNKGQANFRKKAAEFNNNIYVETTIFHEWCSKPK